MTKKINKYAKKAATEIRRNGHTVRTNKYLALDRKWRPDSGNPPKWDKSSADHTRFMVDFAAGKHGDPLVREEYLRVFKENPHLDPVQYSLLKAEGLI